MGEGEVKFWRANLGREGRRAREKEKKKKKRAYRAKGASPI